jgi:hypothetical protein
MNQELRSSNSFQSRQPLEISTRLLKDKRTKKGKGRSRKLNARTQQIALNVIGPSDA